MINIIKKLLFLFIVITFLSNELSADNSYFIDFSKVLNQSNAGAAAQKNLQNKFKSESEKFKIEEENLKKLEADLIAQKKVLSNEEYKNKIDGLRGKVADLQKRQQTSLNDIAQSRAKAKTELLKTVNPIIKKYMEENNIRLVLDKQSVVLGDTTLEITDKIIEILNKELKSLKIN